MTDIQTMTPEQLLAKDHYAVVRFLDGEYAWTVETYGRLEAAKKECDHYRSSTKGDYRVVRISHGS